MTTFTIHSHVLSAMLQFAARDAGLNGTRAVLLDVLCEITPQSLRLVASDTHVLGILHLTPVHGYELDIQVQCDAPVRVVLPVAEMQPVLKAGKTVTITIDEVTVTASAGATQITLPCRPGDDYPTYARVIPTETPQGLPRIGLDTSLLGKFAAFAKAMKTEAFLDLAFHGLLSPISVRIKSLSSFYGVCMPRQLSFEAHCPDDLLPQPEPPQTGEPPQTEDTGAQPEDATPQPEDAPRTIRLHEVEGIDHFTGTDDDGQVWTQFVVDALAEQQPGACAICGAELQSGWLNMDNGGEEVCDTHVEMVAMREDAEHGDHDRDDTQAAA